MAECVGEALFTELGSGFVGGAFRHVIRRVTDISGGLARSQELGCGIWPAMSDERERDRTEIGERELPGANFRIRAQGCPQTSSRRRSLR